MEVATTNEAICRHGCGREAFGPFYISLEDQGSSAYTYRTPIHF
jgi:hypothetical protein